MSDHATRSKYPALPSSRADADPPPSDADPEGDAFDAALAADLASGGPMAALCDAAIEAHRAGLTESMGDLMGEGDEGDALRAERDRFRDANVRLHQELADALAEIDRLRAVGGEETP